MKQKCHQKYAWIIFVVIGVMILAGAIPHSLGINTDPKLVQSISGQTIDELKISQPKFFNLYNFYFSGGGLSDLGFAFLIIIISLTAYRLGQLWAWYTFLFIPVYFSAWVILSLTLPIEAKISLIPSLITIIVLSLFGLFLPFKKFFPKSN